MWHEHREAEEASFALAVGDGDHFTLCLLNDPLYDRQAKPDALVVQLGCAHELAESCEELGQLLLSDAHTSIGYIDDQTLKSRIITRLHFDLALPCKLLRVFDEVD